MKKHQNLLLRNLGWNELWLANFQYIYDACVHTNEGVGKRSRMMQAIVVKFHPLSVIIKNCNLLLWNHWANWNQTWYKCSLDGALKIGGFFQPEINKNKFQRCQKRRFLFLYVEHLFSNYFDELFFFMLLIKLFLWSMPTDF